ncbi:hypothetical protein SEA_FIZZLES_53 [Microbacterium phage Fizzles]|nr:hypothetical protein SEA_FIZZLES_53 [Microbacterium phage Fizzles]
MANLLPLGRHDITIARPGVIAMPPESVGALQLQDVEALMELEVQWRHPHTGDTSPTYKVGWDRQERAVITTEWKEAERGR